MINRALVAIVLALSAVMAFAAPADARPHRRLAPQFAPECFTIMPCEGAVRPSAGFLAGVKSIKITMKRERVRKAVARISAGAVSRITYPSWADAALVSAVAKPARYIAGRLICAVNVGSALAERGIKGTGSALALSYLKWGQASPPVPGAVAVSSRRGGGHVAIVSRVEGGQVYVWNPSPRGRGWQEVAYRHRALSYRVPG